MEILLPILQIPMAPSHQAGGKGVKKHFSVALFKGVHTVSNSQVMYGNVFEFFLYLYLLC